MFKSSTSEHPSTLYYLCHAEVQTEYHCHQYARGEVTGNIGQINVTFASFSVTNQSLLYVTSQNQTSIIENKAAAGLLGLGFDTLSNINGLVQRTFPGATWGRSLLSNIFLSNPLTPIHIAFRLNRLYDSNQNDTGSFDIGTFASGFEAVNDTDKIPVFSLNPGRNMYWTVLVDGFAVNGKNQTPADDTETRARSYHLRTHWGFLDRDFALYIVPCEAQTNVTFYIG
ncbi:aspartic peptidase A1, putative [Rhizoctonia solani AG-3 Rhs1AP]|nr:aspartic peptidase A1, putative [Rhizoctonia solani AG-3 Rhs1AP]